jgi:hypothetical protein
LSRFQLSNLYKLITGGKEDEYGEISLQRLVEARNALRDFYHANPGKPPADELVSALNRAHDEYRADVERQAAEKAREKWEQGL